MSELEASIRQLAISVAKIFVDRAGIYKSIIVDFAADLLELDVEHDVDVVVVQHIFEHRRITRERHTLMLVGEIAIIVVQARRDARGHRLVEFGRVETPLFARISLEEFFVEIASHLGNDRVFGGADRSTGFRDTGEIGRRLRVGFELQAVKLIERVAVDRHRDEPLTDVGQDPVLVGTPAGEARQVGQDIGGVRMENVRPVFMNEDARLVPMIVGVAADMWPLVDQQHTLAEPGREPLGENGAGEPRADDQIVITAP